VSDHVRGLRAQIGSSLLHMPSVSTALLDTESRSGKRLGLERRL
jgi:hypothetical protein